ncbi:lantibiotic dehydratase [uncultured Thermomonospora sp.]|uniref:lantibiotic dehydratase n=1 Tax=uncultured Thermomonospora sp. TaxID=671175 RepID=UPI00259BE969|nr:lantibiotic dehydratase [uncultured Thermomonospora sp.]
MYRYVDAAVVRMTAWPAGRRIESWPDLTGPAAEPAAWRLWLQDVLQIPGFADALEQASPVLTHRVRQICSGQRASERTVRRAVLSVMRYLLRAQGRATPFGLFAGVTPARIADLPVSRIGVAHRAFAGVDARRLMDVVERLEADPSLRSRLLVVANNLVFERDGHLVLEHRPGGSRDGPPAHVQVRATEPVRTAMESAHAPIRLGDLAGKLAARFPDVPADVIDALLSGLVAQRLLVTSLRPPMATANPLGHVLEELRALGPTGEAARIAMSLGKIAGELVRHDNAPTAAGAGERRKRLAAATAGIGSAAESALTVDLRMDAEFAVPHAVAAEAAKAANLLVRLARRPYLSSGWVAWHGRFLERYGPRALVPVLDAVDADTGIGYPAGYLGGPAGSADDALSERDAKLAALAQRAALRRRHEIVLDDALVADLAVTDLPARVQPTTELTVRVHTADARSLARGEFTLSVVGVSRAVGTTTGRFLHLFDAADRERMAAVYARLPTATRDALPVQISAPPLHARVGNVARAPQVLPHLLPVGEYHDREGALALEDIAVTADIHRIYLISLSRRRPVEPVVLNAVEPVNHTHPLVRFLTEATHALSVPCTTFDWGAAGCLPFLPALRYGRTLLCPARWRLTAADLPSSTASWQEWDDALSTWRYEVALPRFVHLGEGDQRIGLDLSEPSHRMLLREQVKRTGSAVLRALPESVPLPRENATKWADGHAHEIVIPLATTARPADPPSWLRAGKPVGRSQGHLPGVGGRFYLKLYGHPDRQNAILTRHLPRLLDGLGDRVQWWFLRYRDPEEHLRLRLAASADDFAPLADRIGSWSQELRRAGLTARVQWDTYFPEVARFGGGAAMAAAEAYFAADSAAALAQLTTGCAKGGPHLRALTAAGLLDLVIAWFGDSAEAMRWLIDHTRPQAPSPDRALHDQALTLADPNDHRALAAQPGGEQILACWARRRTALAVYRAALREPGRPSTAVLLPDLLHLHHVRMAGTDPDGEHACLHLARAAALSQTARAKNRS